MKRIGQNETEQGRKRRIVRAIRTLLPIFYAKNRNQKSMRNREEMRQKRTKVQKNNRKALTLRRKRDIIEITKQERITK